MPVSLIFGPGLKKLKNMKGIACSKESLTNTHITQTETSLEKWVKLEGNKDNTLYISGIFLNSNYAFQKHVSLIFIRNLNLVCHSKCNTGTGKRKRKLATNF